MEQLKQAALDAAKVSGGEGECSATVTATVGGFTVTDTAPTTLDAVTNVLTGSYEGIIQATSYAIERVINAVNSN